MPSIATMIFSLLVFGSSSAVADDKTRNPKAQTGHQGQYSKSLSVMYGGEPEMDACGGLAKVSGLRKGGDGFLAVREAPDVRAREVDRLKNAEFVIECDAKGDWVGIVYESSPAARKKHPTSCGTSSSKKERGPYQGPCKSGWAHRKWITPEAG
jgi:hypothetical protein